MTAEQRAINELNAIIVKLLALNTPDGDKAAGYAGMAVATLEADPKTRWKP